MKKILGFFAMILAVFCLGSCSPKSKTFTGEGISITLNSSFSEIDVINWHIALQSTETIFMGSGTSKSGYSSLASFANDLSSSTTHTEITEREGKYLYCYYTLSVEGIEFGYMFIAKEGAFKYYAMNFCCKSKNLEKNKSQYLKWADTIVVE